MNKLLIVLLAVCLVSVHAFVKRDVPAVDTSDLQKQLQDLQAKFEEFGKAFTDKAAEVLDPEAIKKKLEQAAATAGQAVDAAKDALDKLKPGDAKPAAA